MSESVSQGVGETVLRTRLTSSIEQAVCFESMRFLAPDEEYCVKQAKPPALTAFGNRSATAFALATLDVRYAPKATTWTRHASLPTAKSMSYKKWHMKIQD